MARFDNGIAWYEIGTVTLRVAFPEGGACMQVVSASARRRGGRTAFLPFDRRYSVFPEYFRRRLSAGISR